MQTLILLCMIGLLASQKLEEYNVDLDGISVSGISSGAAFASQFHVAHSSTVIGAGIVAGVPYWCSWGNIFRTGTCMSTPNIINVGILIAQAQTYSNTLMIDNVNHLGGSKVFIIHGTEDETVLPGSAQNIEEFYHHFAADIEVQTDLQLGHGYPTVDTGVSCPETEEPYINSCNYDGALEMLNFIYGGELVSHEKNNHGQYNGELLDYNQEDFLTWRLSHSFDKFGYVYVPIACSQGELCKLHIAFHGCSQGREFVGDEFVTKSGYLEVADENNIIILFPQIKADFFKGNSYGCWDWWAYEYNVVGFLDINFATKIGLQVDPIKSMLNRVAGL